MIKLLKHINHVIEAPFLDAYDPDGIQLHYCAILTDKESGKKTAEFPSILERIDDDIPLSKDNSLVTFKIFACGAEGFSGDGIDIFDEGAKIALTIYDRDHNQAWYNEKAYKIIDNDITCQL